MREQEKALENIDDLLIKKNLQKEISQKKIDDAKKKKDEIDAKIAKLKKEQALANARFKTLERKKRTHEIIQMGALMEKYFGFKNHFEAQAFFSELVKHQNIIDSISLKIPAASAELERIANEKNKEQKETP